MEHPVTTELSADLIQSAIDGQSGALKEIIEISEKKLFRFCLYLCGNTELAQDLCQDSFIKTLENIHRLKNPAAFKGWLFQTAKNLFLDHVKSKKNQAHGNLDDIPESMLPVDTPNFDEILETRRVLSLLQPDDRAILILIDLEEYSYLDAAKIMGISENAARSRLHRVRNEFKDRLKKSETKFRSESSQ